MKKILIYTLALGLILPIFNGCKKGADDPGISLRSRDARITGIWKLVDITESIETSYSVTENGYTKLIVTKINTSYSGSKREQTILQTTTEDTGTAPNIRPEVTQTFRKDIYDHTLEVELMKDNSASFTEANKHIEECETNTATSCITVLVTPPTDKKNSEIGSWHWLNSKKNKIAILGPHEYFTGNIKRLSNKELIFEEVINLDTYTKDTEKTVEYKETSTKTYSYEKL